LTAVGTIFAARRDVLRVSARARVSQFSLGLLKFLEAWPLFSEFGSQLAALGLMLVGLGAIYEKIVVWHIGFWGEKTYGWHYDLMLLVMNLVVGVTNGGSYILRK
jgi:hypothetical protein